MNTNSPRRHSLRLSDYDYSSEGAYFVTIVTQGRLCLFGEINNGVMQLSPAGLMVEQVCEEIPRYIAGVELNIYQIMPNHFHAIIFLNPVGATLCGCPINGDDNQGQTRRSAPTQENPSLSNIVQRFKSLTTNRYIAGVRQSHWQEFDHRLWQRNYYEHIIRDEHDLLTITDYILTNPQNWDKDDENNTLPKN